MKDKTEATVCTTISHVLKRSSNHPDRVCTTKVQGATCPFNNIFFLGTYRVPIFRQKVLRGEGWYEITRFL
jgi:hypothetical protein